MVETVFPFPGLSRVIIFCHHETQASAILEDTYQGVHSYQGVQLLQVWVLKEKCLEWQEEGWVGWPISPALTAFRGLGNQISLNFFEVTKGMM